MTAATDIDGLPRIVNGIVDIGVSEKGPELIVLPTGLTNVVMTGDLFVPHWTWTDLEGGGDPAALLVSIDRLLDLVPVT